MYHLPLIFTGVSIYNSIPTNNASLPSHKPMLHQEFINSEARRKRYWARAVAGSRYFYSVKPNRGHKALTVLEKKGLVTAIITQNVDRLHQAAGSKRVVELHGHSGGIRCLTCETEYSREGYHEHLRDANRAWFEGQAIPDIRADGDADLIDKDFSSFQVLPCTNCGGVVMPTIVFFGGTVPQEVKQHTSSLVSQADKLLVVGSSVSVFSSFRLCKEAKVQKKELCILNVGETRADSLADLKVEAQVGELLSKVAEAFKVV